MADNPVKKLKPKALEAKIKAVLASRRFDKEIRDELEALAENPSFSGFTYLWGPDIYQRNRVFFRPFILNHFSSVMFIPPWRWKEVPWKGETGRVLDDWLASTDQSDDVPLFRDLYSWKHFSRGRTDPKREFIRRDFIDRYEAAETPAQRNIVLEKFKDIVTLDEVTALKLYRADPQASRGFILNHMPLYYWSRSRGFWSDLMQAARDQGDEELYFKLYRRQVPYKQWRSDVLDLADRIESADELCTALDKHHLEDYGTNLSETFHDLLEKRGRDVFPYVTRHLTQVWRRFLFDKHFERLIELSEKRDWTDLWAGLVRVAASPERFNHEVKRLIEQVHEGRTDVVERLLMLAGVSREFNFPGLGMARVTQLDDRTACLMYAHFPELLAGPFKANISISGWGETYSDFLSRLLHNDETELLDYLASRVITHGNRWAKPKQQSAIELLADYYQALQDNPARFAARGGRILGQIPAYSIYDYNGLLKANRLARLFFERSSSFYLSDPMAMSELVEAAEIHVMALAYRALGLDLPEAREQASAHLDILLGTLLRPLHRRTRMLAFGALFNAAGTPDQARRVHDKAREALDLPDIKFPKEQLVGLIGRLLHRWPELRLDEEQQIVYGKVGS